MWELGGGGGGAVWGGVSVCVGRRRRWSRVSGREGDNLISIFTSVVLFFPNLKKLAIRDIIPFCFCAIFLFKSSVA